MNTHQKFVFYGQNAKEWMRKCELLLPEIARKEIWKQKRFKDIYHYAAVLAGMSRRKVDECLRVLRRIEDKPELQQVAEEKGIQNVRPVAAIATQQDAGFWAEKASTMSKHALEKYVQSYRSDTLPGEDSQPVKIIMELDPEIAKKLQKMKGDQDWNEFMEQLMQQEKPETVQTESRHIPEKIKRYTLAKTGGKCARCNRKYHAFHHINRFATTKEHDPDKIIPLCKGCHQLAHLGYIENEHDPPHLWRVREQPKPGTIDLKYQQHARSP